MNASRVKLGGLAAAMVLAVTGSVLAQGEKPLSGPPVKSNRPKDMEGQFAEGKGDRRGAMADRVPARVYLQAVNKLRGDDAPEGLRLSAAQEEKVNAIQEDFRKQARAAQDRAKQDRERKGDEPMQQGQQQGQPEQQRRRDAARQEELRRYAPNAEDIQVKVWAVLSEPQQKFVQAEVQKAKEELDKRRGEEYMQRQIQQQKGKQQPGAGAPPGGGQQPPAPEARERARRIMERLQRLPPEEREQILRRLEQELDRRAPKRGGQGDGGQRKAPPKIEDVKVPPPDKPK